MKFKNIIVSVLLSFFAFTANASPVCEDFFESGQLVLPARGSFTRRVVVQLDSNEFIHGVLTGKVKHTKGKKITQAAMADWLRLVENIDVNNRTVKVFMKSRSSLTKEDKATMRKILKNSTDGMSRFFKFSGNKITLDKSKLDSLYSSIASFKESYRNPREAEVNNIKLTVDGQEYYLSAKGDGSLYFLASVLGFKNHKSSNGQYIPASDGRLFEDESGHEYLDMGLRFEIKRSNDGEYIFKAFKIDSFSYNYFMTDIFVFEYDGQPSD